MDTKLPLYLALLTLTQCSSCKDLVGPSEQLPPATQTGAGTFGCRVNGQLYLPSGNNGTANFSVNYDPTYHGGTIDIRTYRYPERDKVQYLVIGNTDVNRPGVYPFGSTGAGAFYTDALSKSPCNYYHSRDAGNSTQGTLTITRLDLQAGIVAGTFAFIIVKPGCDTLKVTDGRFDEQL